MDLAVEPLGLSGLLLLTPRKHVDARGYFAETYSRTTFVEAGITTTFVQDNQSLSTRRGTIRGLHFQLAPAPQAKLVRVLAGSIFDVAVDLRKESPTFGRWCGVTVGAARGEQLFIPVGFAHAFCTLKPDTIVAYKVDAFYDRVAERGVRWDDADLAIDWPIAAAEVHVSEKDAALPRLRDLSYRLDF